MVHVLAAALAALTAHAADCARCHPDQAAAHATSRHAAAATGIAFTAALADADDPAWCLGCHAPEGDAGVGCASCHDRGGVVLSARVVRAPHPVLASADLQVAVCAPCHQFALPAAHPWASGVPVQDTVAAWARSPAADAGLGCAACHTAGHRFPGGHDVDLVRAGLAPEVTRADDVVTVVLSARAGHPVPTGDVFRRLVVRVAWDGGEATRTLARQVAGDPWRVVGDTRPAPGAPAVVRVEVPPGPVTWAVELWHADPFVAHRLPEDEVRAVIASGAR